MSRFNLALIGILSFTIAAIAMIPAKFAYSFLNTNTASFQLYDIKGTIWSGQASQLHIPGQVFNKVKWQIHPVSMLLGDITVDIQISDSDYPVKATISRNFFSGLTQAENLKAIVPASLVQQLPYGNFLGLSGTININLPTIITSENSLKTANGIIRLNEGQLTTPVQSALGNIEFKISSKDDDILVVISDQKAPIGIQGTLRIKPDNKFTFKASFTPRPNANVFLINMLKNVGQQQQNGSMLVQYSGVY